MKLTLPLLAACVGCVIVVNLNTAPQLNVAASGAVQLSGISGQLASRPAMPRFVGPPHPLDIDGDGVIEWTAFNPNQKSNRVEDSDLRLFVFYLLSPRDEIGLPRGESNVPGWGPANAEFKRCDLNGDGLVDAEDIQRAVELAP